MVKRKRSREGELEQKLTEARKEIFRALKGAKGLERQRYSKRMRDDKSTPDKIKRIEREILVLKSLNLQQTADAHLNSSLVKVKQLAESPSLPDSIKQGVPKPDMSEEDKAALHNVTSGLFNRVHVREAVDKAIRGVCIVLNVPIPDKKKKGKCAAESKNKNEKQYEPSEANKAKTDHAGDVPVSKALKIDEEQNPFDEMDDEIPSGSDDEKVGNAVEEQETDEEVEEKAYEKMMAMLGSSDEEESGDEDLKAKYQALLGEVGNDERSSHGEQEDDEGDDDRDMDDEDEAVDSDLERRINAANVSLSPSPPPSRKKREAKTKKPAGNSGQTTFLPSLMGGYLSNSESEASDLDLPPPKKRLGQKQRQAIWEKKFRNEANHIKRQAQQQKARDNGWDVRKGAIAPEDGKVGQKSWKKGLSNPLGRQGRRDQRPQSTLETRTLPKRDDEGPLHPSWEARKKAKEAQTTATFTGTKITF